MYNEDDEFKDMDSGKTACCGVGLYKRQPLPTLPRPQKKIRIYLDKTGKSYILYIDLKQPKLKGRPVETLRSPEAQLIKDALIKVRERFKTKNG